MRLIDADALTNDILRRWNTNDDTDFANKEVWKALKEAPTINVEPKWVPCKEKLPEYFDYVLLSSPEYGLKIGERTRKSNVNSWYLNEPLDCDVWHVILSNSWYDLEDFIAWMPLPEPYNGEKKDNENS